jgi:hemerythrin-like domain-containing protein
MQELEVAVNKVLDGDEEAKLDVIANAISYTHLLYRHIDKEDGVVYKYAQNNLSKESLEALDAECEKVEAEATDKEVQNKYINLLKEFEAKA